MSFFRNCFLIVALLFLCSCASMTSVRRSPHYDKAMNSYRTVLVLPASAEVSMVGVGNKKERMYDYETHLEGIIANEIIPALRNKGFNVSTLRNREIHAKKLTNAVLALRSSYNEAREELYKQIAWKEEEAFAVSKNLGRPALEIGKKTNSDMLVLVDYVGTSKTTGARVLNFTVSMFVGGRNLEPGERAVMAVGVIDARSGNLLWTNMSASEHSMFHSGSGSEEDTQNVNALISSAIAQLKS